MDLFFKKSKSFRLIARHFGVHNPKAIYILTVFQSTEQRVWETNK